MSLSVKLDIREDKELRDMIKDMIRGQVNSILREELSAILETEIKRKSALVDKSIQDSFGYWLAEKRVYESLSSLLSQMLRAEVDKLNIKQITASLIMDKVDLSLREK